MKPFFALLLALGAVAPTALAAPSPAMNSSSHLFLGLRDFTSWMRSPGAKAGEITLLSPVLEAPSGWNELVVSWNAVLTATAYLRVEARGIYPPQGQNAARETRFYHLGHWASDPKIHPRESVNGQANADGEVQTDTLILKRRGARLQLRLTLGDVGGKTENLLSRVRFIGLSLLDNSQKIAPREPNRAAWGKVVAVPERFQGDFLDLGGAVWCSPTSVSMILEHWSKLQARPELNLTVPHVAAAVHDPKWSGTGNWSFNAAFAGSFPGFRAYVTRFSDLRDLETWIAAGVPVALSVNYGLLKGPGQKGDGHIVVCNGFTAEGDVIIADPGHRTEAAQKYRVFPRANVVAGWGASHNTVYLIYPENFAIPASSANWDGRRE
ncbi:MAG: C39 family peptidase [Armatimonadetes bacterium]|nr:C39 family peptidase [Armatimonadota bacterium]